MVYTDEFGKLGEKQLAKDTIAGICSQITGNFLRQVER